MRSHFALDSLWDVDTLLSTLKGRWEVVGFGR